MLAYFWFCNILERMSILYKYRRSFVIKFILDWFNIVLESFPRFYTAVQIV